MAREHNSNECNLSDLQEAIWKEVQVSESELVANRFPQGLHPTSTLHADTGANTNPSQPSTNQHTCVFYKRSHFPIHCKMIVNGKASLVGQIFFRHRPYRFQYKRPHLKKRSGTLSIPKLFLTPHENAGGVN